MKAFSTRSFDFHTRAKKSRSHHTSPKPYIISSSKMKFACIALCVQAAGAFIAPAVTQSGESCTLSQERSA